MPAHPRIDVAERRRRIGIRHFLATEARAADPVGVADAMAGMHATDPASVYLGLRARVRDLTHDSLSAQLYDTHALLKVLGMRRTMFVAPRQLASVIQAAAGIDVAVRERKRLLKMLEDAGIATDPVRWLAAVEDQTVATLTELGEATASDLSKRVPALREQIRLAIGKPYESTVGVSTRLLFLLSTEGRIIRGRPKGTWLSSLYRWAPMDAWVDGGLEPWPPERAHAELVRRWLRAFGPGTQQDVAWWTGWTVARTKAALQAVGAVEVAMDGSIGWALPDDIDPTPAVAPWIALLPALDTTTMAWTERGFYLGDHAKQLFDTNGNAGPTIWADGRVVGLWAQRPNGEVVTRLLEPVSDAESGAIDAEAARLTAWLGGDRVFPRFPNPVFQALGAS